MRYFLLAIAVIPLFPAVASAQSWQDWVRQNPTYPTPKPQVAPSPAPPSEPTAPPPVMSTQNPEFVREFMRGCLRSAGIQQRDYCACAVEKLQNSYTIDQVKEISDYYTRHGRIPDGVAEVVIKPCLGFVVQ